MAESRVLRRPNPRPGAAVRLLCLPHAGGSQSLYQEWAQLLPPEVELVVACPPGRLDRIDDPWPASIADMAAGFVTELVPWLDRPWAVFGHSMGALVGYELVLRVQQMGLPAPVGLFASACGAPGHRSDGGQHVMTDDELCAELAGLGGIDPELLALPEMREMVLPVIRGDYELLSRYRPRPGELLSCPVSVFVGLEDVELSPEGAAAWGGRTSGPCEVVEFTGGHFYLSEQPERVIGELLAGLSFAGVSGRAFE
ncbi:Thioesterase PikA5 [Streptomyces xanthophaeus]|uniref:thioesterase II family protein n=1 Tax=Streptomyces xanthophaeus TaxID=67385 RepID=UPI00233EEE58|nr:alpha/beta fold hydrolase [Streptomyces xanthophaeus]WCD86476.1 Thioesterase PikA5 [Streptomyces xanthophaeus]